MSQRINELLPLRPSTRPSGTGAIIPPSCGYRPDSRTPRLRHSSRPDVCGHCQQISRCIWNRAAQKRWTEQRQTASEKLLEKVREKDVFNASEESACCHERHLALAQKLESAVDQRLERAPELSENGLRNLAVVSEAAQRNQQTGFGCEHRKSPYLA